MRCWWNRCSKQVQHQVAPYPSHLVHSDYRGHRKWLKKLQNHFESFLSFGLQYHNHCLQEITENIQKIVQLLLVASGNTRCSREHKSVFVCFLQILVYTPQLKFVKAQNQYTVFCMMIEWIAIILLYFSHLNFNSVGGFISIQPITHLLVSAVHLHSKVFTS